MSSSSAPDNPAAASDGAAAPQSPASPDDASRVARGVRRSLALTIAVWLGLRAATLILFFVREFDIHSDVAYYFRHLSELPAEGLANTLIEYPTPVVWLLQIPQVLGGRFHDAYIVAFMVFMFVLDLAMTAWLWHRGLRMARAERAAGLADVPAVRDGAAAYWMMFTFLIGPLVYTRFDLVPAILAGGALLLLLRSPAVSGGMIALGASFKLWPALLVIGLLGRRDRRGRMWIGFAVTGVVLVVVSVLAGGWDRLFSPLTWQGDRGLQVESVWATPPMVNAALDHDAYQIYISQYQAFEIFGPGVAPMLSVANVMTVLGGLAIIALGVRAWRAPEYDMATGALVMTAIIAILIFTNKTFSPQYMVWLAGPLAVLVLAANGTGKPMPASHKWLLIMGLVLAGATHLIYPLMYNALTYDGPGLARTVATVVLVVRNLGMCIFTVLAVGQSWRELGRSFARRSTVAQA